MLKYILLMSTFLALNCKNEGVIQPDKTQDISLLIAKKVNFQEHCPKCLISKPIGCVHCEICDCCIDEFDHHCYWINKCVGKGNYRFFVFFVVLNLFDLLANLVIGSITLFKYNETGDFNVYRLLPAELYTPGLIVGGALFVLFLSFGFLIAVLSIIKQKSVTFAVGELFEKKKEI